MPMARRTPDRTIDTRRELSLDGRTVALHIRRHRQARRMNLRLDPKGDGIVLTLPTGTAERDGLTFVEAQAGWITARLAAQLPRRWTVFIGRRKARTRRRSCGGDIGRSGSTYRFVVGAMFPPPYSPFFRLPTKHEPTSKVPHRHM